MSVTSNLIGSCEPHNVMTQEPMRFDVTDVSQYIVLGSVQYMN